MTEPVSEAELRQRAISLLARRDHARKELASKLRQKLGNHPALEAVLDWCEENGFIDDRRFAGFFLRSRLERGQGELRIRQELSQRGVANALIEEALAEQDCDWFALAEQTLKRRFRQGPGQDQKEKARQLRFLQYRGFSAEQCFNALESWANDEL